VLFPAAEKITGLLPLVGELRREHVRLREFAAGASAGQLAEADLLEFAALLSSHVRKEEGELFEGIQQALAPEAMQRLGSALQRWFEASGMPGGSCGIPT
ncbi:MAG: hemerythrin domain-containing protein, partial [Candidatus Korobacteraceae bacterium]